MRIQITYHHWLIKVSLAGIFWSYLFFLAACSPEQEKSPVPRADAINLDDFISTKPLERPGVVFKHTFHTKALNTQNQDCTTCHLTGEKQLMNPRFYSLNEDSKKQTLMTLYHDKCIGCHEKSEDMGLKQGPLTCGQCHANKPSAAPAQRPFGMDASLHYRHVQITKESCQDCHHEYNQTTKKLEYHKGKERSCRDCHRQKAEENRSSMRMASHRACIGCHKNRNYQNSQGDKVTGPILCQGCHQADKQAAIKKVSNIPRLKVSQPDFALVKAQNLEKSKMTTVPFNHKAHENYVGSCRQCHHQSQQSCSKCHTLEGGDKSGGINLEQAMHLKQSGHSCIGCHEKKQADAKCAGCHRIMNQPEKKLTSQLNCQTCHRGPQPKAGEIKTLGSALTEQTRQLLPPVQAQKLTFSQKQIPETVTIKTLTNKYQPVTYPHQKILTILSDYSKASKLASAFHGKEDVLCQGCHHNSPVGTQPPLCGSCHKSERPAGEDTYMPKLQGAYHLQCIGCHQKMKTGPQDCESCHPKKP